MVPAIATTTCLIGWQKH